MELAGAEGCSTAISEVANAKMQQRMITINLSFAIRCSQHYSSEIWGKHDAKRRQMEELWQWVL